MSATSAEMASAIVPSSEAATTPEATANDATTSCAG